MLLVAAERRIGIADRLACTIADPRNRGLHRIRPGMPRSRVVRRYRPGFATLWPVTGGVIAPELVPAPPTPAPTNPHAAVRSGCTISRCAIGACTSDGLARDIRTYDTACSRATDW